MNIRKSVAGHESVTLCARAGDYSLVCRGLARAVVHDTAGRHAFTKEKSQ